LILCVVFGDLRVFLQEKRVEYLIDEMKNDPSAVQGFLGRSNKQQIFSFVGFPNVHVEGTKEFYQKIQKAHIKINYLVTQATSRCRFVVLSVKSCFFFKQFFVIF
jgi:hypothetical protein